MLNSLSKEDKLKYGVLALIALFMLSTIAQFAGAALSSASGPNNYDPSAPPATYSGDIRTSATIISYDPSIELVNVTDELDEYIILLKKRGEIKLRSKSIRCINIAT